MTVSLALGDHRLVSTRKLIIAALVTGLAILVAFAIQITLAA